MFDWDTSWNCQSGRLTNEEMDLPWFDDDLCFLPVDPPVEISNQGALPETAAI